MSRRGGHPREPSRAVGALALALALAPGCRGPRADPAAETSSASSPSPSETPDPEQFRRQAHARALTTLREHARTLLRVADPVAAAEVEGLPLRPLRFGAAARQELRERLEPALRAAEGIKPSLLSAEDGMALRLLQYACERVRKRLQSPAWRDDPRAVLYALAPYLEALPASIAAGRCDDDGCGLEGLGESLTAGLREVGAATGPTLAATREDLVALRGRLPAWTAGRPADDAVARARPALEAAIDRLVEQLDAAARSLPHAAEVPWTTKVSASAPDRWVRRPARWGAARLRAWLGDAESYGREPALMFDRAEAIISRLRAMQRRDGAAPGGQAPAAPASEAACEAAWEPLREWSETRGDALVASLDCATAWRTFTGDDAGPGAFVVHLVDHGIVEPTRAERRRQVAPDIAMVRGRAAPLAQAAMLRVAVTAGTGQHRAAERWALDQAHRRLCLAAVAVWIHGEQGPIERMTSRLGSHGCADFERLIAEAEARPRAALDGLGLTLIGTGPADAAALDRYWWAPMGMVRHLALPPAAPTAAPTVKLQELSPTGGGSGG